MTDRIIIPVGLRSWHGLGDAFPLDYAFAGARVNYDATTKTDWPQDCVFGSCISFASAMEAMRLGVSSTLDVSGEQDNEDSGSIHFEFTTRGDFNSIQDIRALVDGIAYSAGVPVHASMVRFISNPRRDGGQQPPVNTPGVDPRYTTVPPGGIDTTKPAGPLATAGQFWFPQLNSLASSIGLDSNTLVLLAAVGIIVLMKR